MNIETKHIWLLTDNSENYYSLTEIIGERFLAGSRMHDGVCCDLKIYDNTIYVESIMYGEHYKFSEIVKGTYFSTLLLFFNFLINLYKNRNIIITCIKFDPTYRYASEYMSMNELIFLLYGQTIGEKFYNISITPHAILNPLITTELRNKLKISSQYNTIQQFLYALINKKI